MPDSGSDRNTILANHGDALSAGLLAALGIFCVQLLSPPSSMYGILYGMVWAVVLVVRPAVPRAGFTCVLILLLLLASLLAEEVGQFHAPLEMVVMPGAFIVLLARFWPRPIGQVAAPLQNLPLIDATTNAVAEELFRRVYESVQIGMALLGQDRRVLGVNPRFAHALGFGEFELRGRSLRAVVHPEDQGVVKGMLDSLYATGVPSVQRVVRCVRKDCKIIYLNLSMSIARDKQGEIQFALITADDVTERRNVEERLRQREAEFAHASRVAAVGEMATGLAHEINQPLAAITNYAEASLLRVRHASGTDRPLDQDGIIRDLDDIASQAERASEIIRRLRGFLRKREARRGRDNINDIIREVIEFTQFELRSRQVQVITDLAEVPTLAVDRIQIQQVLVNLIRNAVDAMSETPIEQRELRITSRQSRQAVTVAVIDQGRGMQRGASERLFLPFVSTKPEGLGVGLSISRTIVENHNGRLWAEPNQNQGTIFYFTLPARSAPGENDPGSDQNLVESHLGAD